MRWTGGSLRADLQQLDVGWGVPTPPKLLLWVYLGRILVAVVVFVAAAFYVKAVSSGTILTVSVAALAAVGMSGFSVWYTHVRRAPPTLSFLYAQVLFDLALVTTVVHVTGGAESGLSSLYIPVIAVSSVLMPLRSSLLITVLAGLSYIGDVVWGGQPVQPGVAIWLQIGVFAGVALVTGWIASRVRVVKDEHAVLQQEVQRLSLEASDILHNIGSGVVTVDGNGGLLYANPAAEGLLGFVAADLEGRSAGGVLSGCSPALWEAITATQRGRHRTLRAEGLVRLPGRSFPIGLTTTALSTGADESDSSPTVTAIFRDISDQKRLEELHLRTQRLEAVAELSASLAHEIRNPLASIRTSVEQLGKSVHTGADERFLAQLVVRESDRLSRILSEFLDFSRVRVTRCRPVDLGEVADGAVDLVRRHPACTSETTIEVECSGVAVEGDEDLLHSSRSQPRAQRRAGNRRLLPCPRGNPRGVLRRSPTGRGPREPRVAASHRRRTGDSGAAAEPVVRSICDGPHWGNGPRVGNRSAGGAGPPRIGARGFAARSGHGLQCAVPG